MTHVTGADKGSLFNFVQSIPISFENLLMQNNQ
ncbi:hypothetical protein CLV36_108127 [Laceyella sediminis]|uniref:Uncharacterized protein n=2 Tax=Laceyella TaxID=292635 RepID=A0AA45WL29_9BACL|nr:hypothetical protein CLV36_108127 [Laceyella sediminis]SMP09653.1 hypothetical protein SAMN06265361_102109 [Laceyella tengchongensis]